MATRYSSHRRRVTPKNRCAMNELCRPRRGRVSHLKTCARRCKRPGRANGARRRCHRDGSEEFPEICCIQRRKFDISTTYLADRFRQPFADVVSFVVISYLKLSASRLSIRPSAVSACGYIKNPTGLPLDPGSETS